MAKVGRIKLGSQGLEVSAQGLGFYNMYGGYGTPKPELDNIALIHHAIHSGVTFLDTSDIYGPHTNEILLGKTFNKVQKLLSKTKSKLVDELMTPAPMVVRETTNLEDAARLLLETKFRCLPIVDANGKLVRDSCPSIVQRPW